MINRWSFSGVRSLLPALIWSIWTSRFKITRPNWLIYPQRWGLQLRLWPYWPGQHRAETRITFQLKNILFSALIQYSLKIFFILMHKKVYLTLVCATPPSTPSTLELINWKRALREHANLMKLHRRGIWELFGKLPAC